MYRVAAATLALALLTSTVWADVIPSQHPDPDAAPARAAVSARIQEMGIGTAEADARARRLSDEQARYFAADLNRVQFAGQAEDAEIDNSEKMVYGTIFLTAAIGTVVALIVFRE